MVSTGAFGGFWARIYALLYRNPKSNRVIVEHAGIRPDDRVLDVGCGPGAALEHASRLATEGSVTGVDPTERFARLAAARVPSARVEVAGAEALPFEDDSFTVVWSIAAFHHWPDQEAGLSEAKRVLHPGGVLHIAERATDKPGMHGLDPSGIDSLIELMGAVGFDGVETATLRAGRKEMAVVTATAV